MKSFKQFHGIDRDINLQYKQDNGLFVWYGKWIRLTKNDGSFYEKSTLKPHGRDFMRAVGLIPRYQPPSMDQIKSGMSYIRKESLDFVQIPHTIGNFLKGDELNLPSYHKTEKDLHVFLEEFKPKIHQVLTKELSSLGGKKFQLGLKVQLHKDDVRDSPTFYHKQMPITNKDEIGFENAFVEIENHIDKWTKNGSNWVVDRVETLWINMAQYQPLRGGSYIDLPTALKNKQAIINVQNKDDDCLRWALRSALFPVENHAEKPSKYSIDDGLNFKGIEAPTPISQIKKWKDKTISQSMYLDGMVVLLLTN